MKSRLTTDAGEAFSPSRYSLKSKNDAILHPYRTYDLFYEITFMVLQKLSAYEDIGTPEECAEAIKGEKYIIYDIFLRMLKPEELKLMQGFPRDYIINRDYNFKSYPVAKQVARIGNSVVPIMAQKLVEANCPYLKVGVRVPNLNIDDSQEQLRFA